MPWLLNLFPNLDSAPALPARETRGGAGAPGTGRCSFIDATVYSIRCPELALHAATYWVVINGHIA
eukprot:3124398-Pyramimonas_sp.AAC.1